MEEMISYGKYCSTNVLTVLASFFNRKLESNYSTVHPNDLWFTLFPVRILDKFYLEVKNEVPLLTDCCTCPLLTDLSGGLGEHRHIYCGRCKSHLYKGKQYTMQEWDTMVNG